MFHTSLTKIKDFANDAKKCRRVALMEVFGERANFTSCDNCDNCRYKIDYGEVEKRDFTREFAMICAGITCFGSFGVPMSKLQSAIISSKAPNDWAGTADKLKFAQKIKKTLVGKSRFTIDRFKNFLSLANKAPLNFTVEEKKTSQQGGSSYSNSYVAKPGEERSDEL